MKFSSVFSFNMTLRDFLWLSENELQYYENYDLRFEFQSMSFMHSLYLNFRYLTGNLKRAPFYDNIFNDYLEHSWFILQELCKRGVYVQYGSRPSNIVRSCFNFTTVINDEFEVEFISLLKSLYFAGVNVCVKKIKNGKSIK